MPLGSITEWRARIGSSWCALGRPFKTRSPFRGGAGRLQTQLTLSQVVTMMTLLIMFTAINLALRIVWTTAHYRAYLGLVASWTCLHLKIIGPHLYQSLRCITSALPWLLVLCDLGRQPNQQKNSKQTRTLLLLVCVVVTLLESVQSIAASVIFYQLLQSGDVEQNPGPDIDYDRVDSEKVLDEKNLFDVMEELAPLDSTCYYYIGIGLRLSTSDLNSIESSFKHDPRRALTMVVSAWLQKSYSVEDFGPPTWQMLVKAVDSPAGGNDHTLAQKIASNHPAKGSSTVTGDMRNNGEAELSKHDDLLNISNIREVLDETWNYRARWRFIGIKLGIDEGTLDAIEATCSRNVDDCVYRMISAWLKNVSPRPTRTAMKAALQSERILSGAVSDSNSGPGANKLVEYTAYLTSLYKAKSQSCYLGDDHWPPPVTEKVFRLAMITAEEVKRMNTEDDIVRHTITGKVGVILKKKVPIELENIFANIKEGQQRKVLIEGAPGCGKSTLSLHICHEWTKDNLFTEYSQVILVRLRELTVKNAQRIADLLPRRDDTMGHDLEKEINSYDGKGILFVFDGWDELPTDAPGYKIIKNILNSETLHKSSIIITSRPISSTSLQQIVNSRIEILGFTKDELQHYFRGCLNDDMKKVTTLQQRIGENPLVAGSCYLPLNASILVHLFKCGGNVLPGTQYGIFYELVYNCVRRHLMKIKRADVSKLKSLEELPPSVQTQFQELCIIAYEGVMNDRIIFDLEPGFSTLGLLQGVESFTVRGKSHSYNFLHLSIQELLAAIYMATQLKEDQQIEQFRNLFGRARFSAVFQFYAAKTKMKTPGINEIVIEVVKKCAQDSRITEFSGSAYSRNDDPATVAGYNLGHEPQPLLLSLLHCLFEAQDQDLCQLVAKELKGKLNLAGISLSPADCLSVGYFLTHCRQFKVYLAGCSIGDDGCKALFRKGPKYDLRYLSLRNNAIGAEGAKALSEAMKTTTNLQGLYLQYNAIGDEGAKALSEAMKTMINLQGLVLMFNAIGDEGAKALSEAMKTMTNLQTLDLINNAIGAEGAKALSEAMKTMTNLQWLNVGANSIGAVGREALEEAAKETGTKIDWSV